MSTAHATAAIVSQGDEIVLGQTLDTNSKWIAEQLLARGIEPVEHVSLPDDQGAIAAAFARLAGRVDLIVCSGGLGPTADDLTRAALAAAMDEPMVEDAEAVVQIEAWFASRGREMPTLNRVQALRPRSGRLIQNFHGTAPGVFARVPSALGGRGADVYCLPGPPREMFPMFLEQVSPELRPPGDRVVRTHTLHTIGLGESDVATLFAGSSVGDLMARDRSTLVGTTASGGVVSMRVRAVAETAERAEADLEATLAVARPLLGAHVFADERGAAGQPHEALPAAVIGTMRRYKRTLAVVESCTAGLLGAMLGDIPGASDVFLGGAITYANAAKTTLAHVPAGTIAAHGAVSRETAAAMAVGGLNALAAMDCLAITGIAGQGGGSEAKPVGMVWVALARAAPGGPLVDVRRFNMAGDRRSVREWAARAALTMLWMHLSGAPGTPLLRQVEPKR